MTLLLNFPVYLHFGETKILLHVILEFLAFFTGFRYFLFLKKKHGDVLTTGNRTWIIIATIFGALAGSRLLGGLEDPPQIIKADNVLLYFYMNKTVLGGFLGGLWAVEAVKKMLGEKTASGDLFVYPIIFALIIGRLGCFSTGLLEETYGVPTTLFTGIELGDGIPRHPVTIYEIFYLAGLWIMLKIVATKFSLANGSLFKLFMMAYLLFRFLLDFIKPHYTWSIGLSSIQIAALLGLLWYIQFIIYPKKLIAQPA
ncbi:MAG: prolipoprotein diacylglyceryl transferase family protein [Ferruginibacter sp.]